MFSHYSIEIIPFKGQGLASSEKNNPKIESSKSQIIAPVNPISIGKPTIEKKKVQALNTSYNSGNLGILDALTPRTKKNNNNEALANISERENFTQEKLHHCIQLFAYKKKNEEGKDSLFSTLTSCKLTIHNQVDLKLHLLNAVQAKELDFVKMELLAYLRNELKNGAITFDHVLEESKEPVVSFTDKKSQFDKLANENPSLEKFRKLFNLDIEY